MVDWKWIGLEVIPYEPLTAVKIFDAFTDLAEQALLRSGITPVLSWTLKHVLPVDPDA